MVLLNTNFLKTRKVTKAILRLAFNMSPHRHRHRKQTKDTSKLEALSQRKSILLTHSRTSTSSHDPSSNDKNPFFCLAPGCTYRTKRESDIQSHVKAHPLLAPMKRFSCPSNNCPRVGQHGFRRKDHMMEHVAFYHRELIRGKKAIGTRKIGGR